MVAGFGLLAAYVGAGYVWGSAVASLAVDTGFAAELTPVAASAATVLISVVEEAETMGDAEVSGV